jgi:hypothetical protein
MHIVSFSSDPEEGPRGVDTLLDLLLAALWSENDEHFGELPGV